MTTITPVTAGAVSSAAVTAGSTPDRRPPAGLAGVNRL